MKKIILNEILNEEYNTKTQSSIFLRCGFPTLQSHIHIKIGIRKEW